MLNECIPFYDDGDDITGLCSAGVTGKRCVKISGNRSTGGVIQIAHADPGGRIFGVAGYDGASGEFVRVLRGTKSVVPVLAGAAIAAFEEVMVGTAGAVIPVTARTDEAAATVATGVVASNNAIRWTARVPGVGGNSLQVAIVVAGNSTALSVVVAGNLITVNSATDGGGAATSTAAQVITAIRANAAADALVTVANELASSGAGVVAAVGATNLAGGAAETTPVAAIGYAVTHADNATDAQISLY